MVSCLDHCTFQLVGHSSRITSHFISFYYCVHTFIHVVQDCGELSPHDECARTHVAASAEHDSAAAQAAVPPQGGRVFFRQTLHINNCE
jgi:hypothetical protein